MISLALVPWKSGETVRQTVGDASRKVWGEAVEKKKRSGYKGLSRWHYKSPSKSIIKGTLPCEQNKSDRSRFCLMGKEDDSIG